MKDGVSVQKMLGGVGDWWLDAVEARLESERRVFI
jgi:hypothetical protein